MATWTCLRCGSLERFEVNVDSDNGQLHLAASFKTFALTVYVCGECGHVERYVRADKLPALRQRARRLPATE